MVISKNNTRVVLTLPNECVEAFRADAADLNMSLSVYTRLVLSSWSSYLPDFEVFYANEVLGAAQSLKSLEASASE